MAWLRKLFETEGPDRLLAMEGLRGLAVLLVFLHHYATQTLIHFAPSGLTEELAHALKRYGNLGVELFFVLSGFLIYGLLISKSTTLLQFARRRVIRIYPAFLVAFTIALAFELPVLADRDWFEAIGTVIANLLLLPGLFPLEPILTVAWSLSYEIFFYVATAVVVIAFRMRLHAPRSRVIFLSGATALFVFLCLLGTPGVPVRMLPFFAGMILFETTQVKAWRVNGYAGLLAPVIAFVIGESAVLHPLVREAMHTIAFFTLCAACFSAGSPAASGFSWAPLRWLGNMSYSYYLMHGFAVTAGARMMGRLLQDDGSPVHFWTLLPVLFVLSLVPSALLFMLVEKPISLQRGRKAKPAFQPDPAPAR